MNLATVGEGREKLEKGKGEEVDKMISTKCHNVDSPT